MSTQNNATPADAKTVERLHDFLIERIGSLTFDRIEAEAREDAQNVQQLAAQLDSLSRPLGQLFIGKTPTAVALQSAPWLPLIEAMEAERALYRASAGLDG